MAIQHATVREGDANGAGDDFSCPVFAQQQQADESDRLALMVELRAQNDEIREQNEGLAEALSALMLQRAKEEEIRRERDVALGELGISL